MKSIFVFAFLVLFSSNIFAATKKSADLPKSKIGFVSTDRVMLETAIGRSCSNSVQTALADRQRTVAQMNEAARKAKPGEAVTKLEEIHNFELNSNQEILNIKNTCEKNIYTALKNETAKVLAAKHLELIIPESPLVGGLDVTDDVVQALNAANIDALAKLAQITKENEELKKKAAEKQPTQPATDKK